MEDGRRLENLSWRLWNRETFCCAPRRKSRASIPVPQAGTTDIPAPELSSSIESASSEELDEHFSHPQPPTTTIPKARPEIWRRDCSRGREKHITPVDLEKIVISIKENQELEPIELPMPTPSIKPSEHELHPTTATRDLSRLTLNDSVTPQLSQPAITDSSLTTSRATLLESSASTVDTNDDEASQTVGSETSSNTEMSAHSIIRGFVPGGAPSSYRSQTNLAAQPTPILKTSPQYAQAKTAKKKGPMFTIGTSSGEDESSLDSHMYRSQLSESLRRPHSTLSGANGRKQTSFKDEVAVGRAAHHDAVFESDDEDEEVSESAIEDDDDSSDWEDSEDMSGPSSVNEKEMFQRVDSRPNLTSRRSLLTTLMHEPDRAKALANAASRSTPHIRRSGRSTPNGPSVGTSPESGIQITAEDTATASRARPIIMTTSNTHPPQLALSPRTTRRNMLSTELTESLRKNLLWERQHRSTGNLAALKRRHTSTDVKNLRQHPEPAPVLSHQDGTKQFTNDYFHAGLQEYHAKGW